MSLDHGHTSHRAPQHLLIVKHCFRLDTPRSLLPSAYLNGTPWFATYAHKAAVNESSLFMKQASSLGHAPPSPLLPGSSSILTQAPLHHHLAVRDHKISLAGPLTRHCHHRQHHSPSSSDLTGGSASSADLDDPQATKSALPHTRRIGRTQNTDYIVSIDVLDDSNKQAYVVFQPQQ